jgi:hypothetical protein
VRPIFPRFVLPLFLLGTSVVTTTADGARFMQNFVEGMPPVVRESDLLPWPWLFAHPELFLSGWPFSFTLLGILLVHEFGHYFACRWHGIRCTLPWVLPAPTLSGTVGAVIQLRSRIANRRALLDVGIYGPLAGFAASLLAVAVGFALSYQAPADAPRAIVRFGGDPLVIRLLHALLVQWDPTIPNFDNIAPHPVLVAGWIGIFITALNLIPCGQLDGGRILYAISPRAHRVLTAALPFLLVLAGAVFWVGWMVWGILLMVPALRRIQIPTAQELDSGRKLLGVAALVIFLLTFTLTPFYDNSLMHFVHIDPFARVP